MIGGVEERISSKAGNYSLECGVRAVRQIWEHAVFENGQSGERYQHFGQIPFHDTSELFVYENSEFADLWEKYGAVDGLGNTMIHLLYHAGELTVVMDQRDETMLQFIEAIASSIHDCVLLTPC